jgi:putative endonuclease
MYYVYLLQSEKDGRLYIGQTNDIQSRVTRHNHNRCMYTRHKGPWQLIGYKQYKSRPEAVQEELRLKRIKNRSYLVEYFKDSSP